MHCGFPSLEASPLGLHILLDLLAQLFCPGVDLTPATDRCIVENRKPQIGSLWASYYSTVIGRQLPGPGEDLEAIGHIECAGCET